jgi:hypothetical protein
MKKRKRDRKRSAPEVAEWTHLRPADVVALAFISYVHQIRTPKTRRAWKEEERKTEGRKTRWTLKRERKEKEEPHLRPPDVVALDGVSVVRVGGLAQELNHLAGVDLVSPKKDWERTVCEPGAGEGR